MAYAPGVQSMGGQFIAQGVQQGLASLAQAILGRAEERKKKEDMAEAVKTLQPLIEKMAPGSGVNLTKDTPKEAIPQVIQLAGEVGRMQREAPLRGLQVENERLRQRISRQELDAAAANAAALPEAAQFLRPRRVLPSGEDVQSAFSAGQPVPGARQVGPDYNAAMGTYLSRGGTDPRILAQLGDLAQQEMKGQAVAAPLVFASEKDLQARYPADRYDYKMVPDPSTGRVRVENLSPRAPQTTLPPGYEPDPAKPGAIRPIPGSEGDVKRQDSESSRQLRQQNELTRADVILNAIKQVAPKVDGYTAGFAGTALNKIPGTEANDVAATIDTIKANIGFEQLQNMRAASPTGGALGQVAVKELDFLQASLGNLSTSQSPKRLKKVLGEVQEHYQRWRMAASGIDPDAEAPAAPAAAAKPAAKADPVARLSEIENRLAELRAKQGK